MTALRGKVMTPDGVNKVFKYADVKVAVEYLKKRVSNYSNHNRINKLINELFYDVTKQSVGINNER